MVLGSLMAALLLSRADQSLACTAIAVGKDASATGYPMVGHSEDSGPVTNDVRLVRVPRQQWPEGSMRPLYNWQPGYPRVVSTELGTPDYGPFDGDDEWQKALSVPLAHIPQVSETWGYWDTDYGVQNEWGVSIGESTCTARTVGWPSSLPYGHNNAGIEDLSKIALERCKTARCAVETMGTISVEQGFYSADSGDPKLPAYSGSSECLLVADAEPGEVWIFNIMTGKNNASAIWAAQRVPDNHVTISANSFTIRKMNLSDSKNFVYSPKVSALAEEMGWWSPKDEASPEIFDFYRSYGYTPNPETVANPEFWNNVLSYYSGRRMWRVFSLLSPEEGAKLDPSIGNLPLVENPYPNSVPAPRHSITNRMVMDVYRDHYEGTPYDLTQGMAAGPHGNPNRGPTPLGLPGLWERAISMYRTTWSFVLEAKPRGRAVTWWGWDAPHGTAYLPFFGAANVPAPDSYHSREGHMSQFSTKVAFWAFNMVNQYQDLNFELINAEVREKAHQVEKDANDAVLLWEREADAAEKAAEETTGSAAVAVLTQRGNAFVEKSVGEWWTFAFSLFAKFNRYTITHNESATSGKEVVRYPEWWLRSPEVGFTSWSKDGPFHGVVLDEQPALLLDKRSHDNGAVTSWIVVVACACVIALLFGWSVGLKQGFGQGKRSLDTNTDYYAV